LRIEKRFAKTRTGKIFDIIAGGKLIERKLSRRAESLNKKIEDFNKNFTGRQLSERQFNEAQKIQNELLKEEEDLEKEREEFEKSAKRKIGRVVYDPIWGRKDSKIAYPDAMKNAFIKIEKFNVKKYERLSKNAEKKYKTNPSVINQRKLKSTRKNLRTAKDNLASLKTDKNPYHSPSVLDIALAYFTTKGLVPKPKITKVKFIGVQKGKGNKIITDVVFMSGKERVGIARGITVTRGTKGTTVVFGKTGVKRVVLPKGKVKFAK